MTSTATPWPNRYNQVEVAPSRRSDLSARRESLDIEAAHRLDILVNALVIAVLRLATPARRPRLARFDGHIATQRGLLSP